MTAERWALVEQLFHEAAALSASERGRFFAGRNADPEIQREVEVLLASAETELNLVDAAVEDRDRAAATLPEQLSEMVVGPYRLVKLIGKGGMGAVYQAERADREFTQRVAIKLVRADRESPEIVSRFRAERQILASLVHPNIARLLDGGLAAFGTPYLVMEFVDGVPITEYCDRHGIDLPGRLRIFRDVCSAVECAHDALVVHRDIKPGNILVTANGVPKLLDFGIARILNPAGESERGLTRTGDRLLTPEYAAPEQILNKPATTRTDVYALGVLLYELLTGTRPFLQTTSSFDLEQKICTAPAARPSDVLEQTDPAGARRLKGDLDSIVLMALRKEPADRYGSVERLSADVASYLDGFPVVARRGSTRYRAVKFARRNWLPLSFAAVFLFSMIAFAVQLRRERDAAQVAEAHASAAAGFLAGLFRGADPNEARGRTVTARDLLDKGASEIAGDLKQDPGVRADLLDTMAESYNNLGAIDRSVALLEEELRIERSAPPGPVRQGIERTLRELGNQQRELANYPIAEKYLRESLELDNRAGGRGPERSDVLNNLGLVLQERSQLPEAERLLREAVANCRRFPDKWQDELIMIVNLAGILSAEGKYSEAVPLHREALEQRIKRLGDDHPQVAKSRQRLGFTLEAAGSYAEAEAMLEKALADERRTLGDSHFDVLVTTGNLAMVLRDLGKQAEAESLYRSGIATGLSARGERPEVATLLSGLAGLRRDMGAYVESETLYRRAIAIDLRFGGGGTMSEARDRCGLGSLLVREGELPEAGEQLTRCLAIRQEKVGGERPQTAASLAELAVLRASQGQFAEAADLYRRAIRIDRQVFPEGHPQTATHLLGMGRLMLEMGRNAEAEPLAREALDVRRRYFPAAAWPVAQAENEWGKTLEGVGRKSEAAAILARTWTSLAGDPGPKSEPATLAWRPAAIAGSTH